MIYVQHLLGVGHLQRSLQLAAELAQHNFAVELVSGGRPQELAYAKGVRLRQLPPVYSPDGSFTRLLDANGAEVDADWRNGRKQQLLDSFAAYAPQVLITETFPFGRRMMRFELLPLLEAARASANCIQVIASIRDILQPKSKSARNQETCELIEKYYDHVLVHGDQNIAKLADSFINAAHIEHKIFYSGYICSAASVLPPGSDGNDEVLVSAGGSATGLEILKTAITAKPLSSLKDLRWRILVSPAIDESRFDELKRCAGEGIIIERNRPDFSELVKRARLSISQAGYNTITDILSSTTPAVVIPYAEADEVEQTMRAQILQRRNRLVMLQQDRLSAATLSSAVDQAIRRYHPLAANLAGATNSAVMISRWFGEALEKQ
jgi:predicted glycosyltransferase